MELNQAYHLNYIIAIIWIISVAYSLLKLRSFGFNPAAQALWSAIILFFPIVSVIAFLLLTGKQQT